MKFLSSNLSWWQLISIIYSDLLNGEFNQAKNFVDFSYGIFFIQSDIAFLLSENVIHW